MHRRVFLFATTVTACSGGACGAAPAPTTPIATADASANLGADAGGMPNSGATVAEAAAPAAPLPRPRTDSDNGAAVVLSAGQPLEIILTSNPTTGYTWSVIRAPAALGTPKMEMLPPSSSADGAPARQRFTWTLGGALPPGDHALVLEYSRSFERDKPPLKTYRLTLRAAP